MLAQQLVKRGHRLLEQHGDRLSGLIPQLGQLLHLITRESTCGPGVVLAKSAVVRRWTNSSRGKRLLVANDVGSRFGTAAIQHDEAEKITTIRPVAVSHRSLVET